jgi:tetratricopeptide (TPR) repeat protein
VRSEHRPNQAISVAIAGVAAFALAVTATKADDWSDCKSGPVSTVEAACSAIIEKVEGGAVDLAIAYARRGDLHRNRGQPEQALADFAAALQLDPDSVEAYLDRGVTYRDQNRLDEAMADLDRAVQLAPKNPDLRIARASIEELHHVEPDAMTDLMRAIQFRPDQATYSTRAAFYARIGRRDQALAQGAQGIARALKGQFTAGPQVGRGLALLAKGRVKEANAILDRAAETSADSAKAIAARALGLLVAKQVGRAIATLDPSIANGSEEPLMFVLRGKAFYQNGELERANPTRL